MRGRLPAWIVVLAVVAAGCVGTQGPESTPDAEPAADVEQPVFGEASPLPEDPGSRDLTQAPDWAAGEWWSFTMFSNEYETEGTFTVVVAGAEEGRYLVGVPADELPVLPFIFHLPGLGRVDTSNLTYDAHDEPFKLLDFPLTEGKTWEGVYWGSAEMEITVEEVDPPEAKMHLVVSNTHVNYTYDASAGQITESVSSANGQEEWGMELVDHGTGYDGPVRVPYDQDLDICHGQAAVVVGVAGCQAETPSPPQGSFEIEEGHEAATFALLGYTSGTMTPGDPGAARLAVDAPTGESFELVLGPDQPRGFQGHTLADPAGTWSYEAQVGGDGVVLVEGVTYDPVEVRLPSGCVLEDAGVDLAGPACP